MINSYPTKVNHPTNEIFFQMMINILFKILKQNLNT